MAKLTSVSPGRAVLEPLGCRKLLDRRQAAQGWDVSAPCSVAGNLGDNPQVPFGWEFLI